MPRFFGTVAGLPRLLLTPIPLEHTATPIIIKPPLILFFASSERHDIAQKVVKFLVAKGTNPDLMDGTGETALHKAVRAGNLELAMFLMENPHRVATVNVLNKDGFNPAHIFIRDKPDFDCTFLQKLFDKGIDPHVKDGNQKSLIDYLEAQERLHEFHIPQTGAVRAIM